MVCVVGIFLNQSSLFNVFLYDSLTLQRVLHAQLQMQLTRNIHVVVFRVDLNDSNLMKALLARAILSWSVPSAAKDVKKECCWEGCLCREKHKGFPYSLLSLGPRADRGVQEVSPQVTISHPPGGRLPLLSARPAFTFPAAEHHRPLAGTKLYCFVTEAHRCEQLAQGCYIMQLLPRVGIEPTTCWSQVQRSMRCATAITGTKWTCLYDSSTGARHQQTSVITWLINRCQSLIACHQQTSVMTWLINRCSRSTDLCDDVAFSVCVRAWGRLRLSAHLSCCSRTHRHGDASSLGTQQCLAVVLVRRQHLFIILLTLLLTLNTPTTHSTTATLSSQRVVYIHHVSKRIATIFVATWVCTF